MISNKRNVLAAVALVLAIVCGPQSTLAGEWLTSYDKAIEQAKKTDKLILADFTGSDWCGWCMKLKAEVFSKPKFKAWAQKNVILLELDYPKNKAMSKELKAQNAKLKKKYGINGYPTILFLNAEGKSIGRSGYQRGGPAAWCKSASGIITEYKKTISIQPARSFMIANSIARKESKLHLILVADDAAQAAQQAKAIFKYKPLVDLVNARMVVSQVAMDNASTFGRFKTMKKVIKAKDDSRLLLVDMQANKLLYETSELGENGKLIENLTAVLPKLEYDGGWLIDYSKAIAIAKQENRPMLLNFTGSDWCGWCIKLKDEVFDTDQFKKYASENIVLVELDFPTRKRQSTTTKAQNKKLAQKYSIRGYPTIIIVDASGNKLGQLGYMKGGAKAFISKLTKLAKLAKPTNKTTASHTDARGKGRKPS